MTAFRAQLLFAGLMALSLLVSLMHWNGYVRRADAWSVNVLSRLIPVERLLNAGTLAMDGSPLPPTVDRVRSDGAYYSSKPPLPTLFYVPVSALLQAVGWSLAAHAELHALVLALVFGFVPYVVVCLAALRRAAGSRLLLAVALGPGSLVFLYTLDVTNHGPAASCVLGALLLRRSDAAAGCLLGLAGAMEHTAWAFLAAFALQSRRPVQLFGWGVPWLILSASYYGWLTGSILPLEFQFGLFDWPCSPYAGGQFRNSGHFLPQGAGWAARYVLFALVGPPGLFVLSPFLAPALAGAGRAALAGDGAARAVMFGFAAVFGFVVLFTEDLGSGTGARWFVHATPALLVFLPDGVALLRDKVSWLGDVVVVCALALGLAMAQAHGSKGLRAYARCEAEALRQRVSAGCADYGRYCAGGRACRLPDSGTVFACRQGPFF